MDIKGYQDDKLKNLQQQIIDLECNHPKKEVRCRKASNNTKMFKSQCVRCGELFGEWIPHHQIKNKPEIIEIDDNLRNNYNQSCFELKKALQDRINKLEKIEFFDWYKDYLESESWLKKRSVVLKRCNYICEGCLKNVAHEVHHKTYKNVGQEFLFELVGLCLDCHGRMHKDSNNA